MRNSQATPPTHHSSAQEVKECLQSSKDIPHTHSTQAAKTPHPGTFSCTLLHRRWQLLQPCTPKCPSVSSWAAHTPTAQQNPANADAKSHIRPQLHTTANKTHKQRVHQFTWTKALQSQRTAATAHAALHTHHSSAKRVLLLRSTHHSSLPSPWIPVASSKQGTRNKRTYKLTTAAPPNTPTQTAHEQHRQHSPSSTAVQSKHTAKNNSSTSCTSHLPQLCKARVAVAGLGCCRLHTICASQCQHLQCSNMHVFTTMQPSRS